MVTLTVQGSGESGRSPFPIHESFPALLLRLDVPAGLPHDVSGAGTQSYICPHSSAWHRVGAQ